MRLTIVKLINLTPIRVWRMGFCFGERTMKTNYFINFMLKYFPDQLRKEHITQADQILHRLKKGEEVPIDQFLTLKMVNGKIRAYNTFD